MFFGPDLNGFISMLFSFSHWPPGIIVYLTGGKKLFHGPKWLLQIGGAGALIWRMASQGLGSVARW